MNCRGTDIITGWQIVSRHRQTNLLVKQLVSDLYANVVKPRIKWPSQFKQSPSIMQTVAKFLKIPSPIVL